MQQLVDSPSMLSSATPQRRTRATNSNSGAHSERIHQLDGLRAIAFALVFIHHAFKIPLLWWGVDLFFVLSGYLITTILLREQGAPGYFRKFYLRRTLRILPPYLLILSVAFIAFPGNSADRWWYLLFLSNVREAIGAGSGYQILSPMWSLAVEEQFYLGWPLVIFLVPVRRFWLAAASAIVMAPIVRALCVSFPTHWAAYELLPSRMDTLALGALLAVLSASYQSLSERIARAAPAIAVVSSAVFLTLYRGLPTFRTGANSLSFNVAGYTLLALIAACVICMTIHLNPDTLMYRVLTSKPLAYLGSISFMMYLSHTMALSMASSALSAPAAVALLAFAITVVIATASWYVLEKPLLTMKDRLIRY